MPEEEAANVLQQIRAGEDDEAISAVSHGRVSHSSGETRLSSQQDDTGPQKNGQSSKDTSFSTGDTPTRSARARPQVFPVPQGTSFEDAALLLRGNRDSSALLGIEQNVQTSRAKRSRPPESAAFRHSFEVPTTQAVRPLDGKTAGPLLPDIASLLNSDTPWFGSESMIARLELPNAEHFDQAFSTFIRCTGKLFPVLTRNQQHEMASQITARKFHLLSKPALCLLCSTCAISAQYCSDKSSREKGEKYYDVARHLFDACVTAAPMAAIQACTMLAMYNINRKAILALTYVDLALSMADRQGFGQRRQASSSTGCIHDEDGHKVWRTLVCIKGWLLPDLPNGPASSARSPIHLLELEPAEESITIYETIQMHLARLSSIKARTLKCSPSSGLFSMRSLRETRGSLQKWSDNLSQNCRLRLSADEGVDPESDIAVCYMHIFYNGALMLLQRQVMSYLMEFRRIEDLWMDGQLLDWLKYVEEGFAAARSSISLVTLLVQKGGLVKSCWLCIFQSYTAATFLMYETAQCLLGGLPKNYALASFSIAKEALQALSACATCDDVAHRLWSLLMFYDRLLSAELDVPGGDGRSSAMLWGLSHAADHSHIPLGYLLRRHDGESDLCRAGRDLLKLLCDPTDGAKVLDAKRGCSTPLWSEYKGTLEELSLGCHLEWATNEVESP